MALTLYSNPRSRGLIIQWLLAELDVPYESVEVEFGPSMKTDDYLQINPMGKVPALVHDGHVVTESAAICAYLADAFPEKGLAPALNNRAEYYRWLFFAAGPLEAATTNKGLGVEVEGVKQGMVGYGHYDLTIHVLEQYLTGKTSITGTFSAADVYMGAALFYGIHLSKSIPERPAFQHYLAAISQRPAFQQVFRV